MKCIDCKQDHSSVKPSHNICSKCLQKQSNPSIDLSQVVMPGDEVIINELLTYAWHYYKSSPFESLRKSLISFYHQHEILEAKTVLWRVFHDKLPPNVSRQDSSSRSAKEAEILDIITAIRKRDTENNISPNFVAKNLT